MKNFYTIYGTEKTMISNEVNNIVDKLKISDVIKYQMDNTSIDTIVEDASTVSMFSNKKVIILDDCSFLSNGRNLDNLDLLLKYLDKYNTDTYLIFICYSEKLDSRKKIVSKLKKCSTILEIKKGDMDYIENYINNILKINNFKIESLDYFINKSGTNLDNIKNELDKLMIYKDDSKFIENQDIDILVTSTCEDEIYALTDAITNKDTTLSLSLMNEFLNKSYDELGLISLIANQYRFMFQVKRLYNKGNNYQEIGKLLEVNPYRVKFTLPKVYYFSEDMILGYLSELANIDANIKMGKINKRLALEMFIINSTS